MCFLKTSGHVGVAGGRSGVSRPIDVGQSTVEFALVVALFLQLIFGILALSQLAFVYGALTNAAREGARYGIVDPTNVSGIVNRVISTSGAVAIGAGNVTVTCSRSPCARGDLLQVTVACPYQSPIPWLIPVLTLRTSATMAVEVGD
jgi:hypothetical protein